MTKIRCGDSLAVDLNQVVAWTKLEVPPSFEDTKVLTLFFLGADSGFSVSREMVGEKAFNRLHKLLIERFAIDLVDDNSLPWANENTERDDNLDEPLDLPF